METQKAQNEQAVADAKTQHEKTVEKLTREQDFSLVKLNQSYAEALELNLKSATEPLAEKARELEVQLAESRKMVVTVGEQKDGIVTNQTIIHEKQIQQLQSENFTKISKMEADHASAISERAIAGSNALNNNLSALKAEHKNELNTVLEELEREKEEKEGLTEKMKKHEELQEEHKSFVKKVNERAIVATAEKHEVEIAQLKSRYEAKIDVTAAEFEEKISLLQSNHEVEITQLKNGNEAKTDDLSSKAKETSHVAVARAAAEFEERISLLQSNHEVEIRAQIADLSKAKETSYEEKINLLQSNHEVEIRAQIADLSKANKAKETSYEEKITLLQSTHDDQISLLSTQLSNTKSLVARGEMNLHDRLDALKADHSTLLENTKTQIQNECKQKFAEELATVLATSTKTISQEVENKTRFSIFNSLLTELDSENFTSVKKIFLTDDESTLTSSDASGIMESISHWAKKKAEVEERSRNECEALRSRVSALTLSTSPNSPISPISPKASASNSNPAKTLSNIFRMYYISRTKLNVKTHFSTWAMNAKLLSNQSKNANALKEKKTQLEAINFQKEELSAKLAESESRLRSTTYELVELRTSSAREDSFSVVTMDLEDSTPVLNSPSHSLPPSPSPPPPPSDDFNLLKEQLQKEKAARKKILAKAANKWISPNKQTLNELVEEVSSAVLEGKSETVASLLASFTIDTLNASGTKLSCLLHRCISGFHFHGNQKLLISTLDVLLKFGVDVNTTDGTGSTALHKAIQVCTSNVVGTVVTFLVASGADVNATNNLGDNPIHTEIRRLRSRSVDVIKILVRAGANVDLKCVCGDSQLTLVLKSAQGGGGGGNSNSNSNSNSSDMGSSVNSSNSNNSSSSACTSYGGRNFWVRVALLLLKNGAKWDQSVKVDNGKSQLMLLFTGPTPPIGDANLHREIVRHNLKNTSSSNINDCDENGRTALLHLCIRESGMPKSTCISSLGILEDFLENGADVNILDNKGAGPLTISGAFKGNGYELLQSKLFLELSSDSVGYAGPVRNVVEELHLAKRNLAKKTSRGGDRSMTAKEKDKEDFLVFRDENNLEHHGHGHDDDSRRQKGFLSPKSGGRRITTSEINELWSQSAKKKFSSRQNAMRK